jgi:NTP pyrophosphatase (non-canonical NTP hydrolase)
MNEWLQIVGDYIDTRITMKQNNSDPKRVAVLLTEEVQEFLEEDDLEKKARECVDIIWLALSWAHMNGIDIDAEFREKWARNICKRPAYLYNNGLTYEEAEQEVKNYWTPEREEEFYQWNISTYLQEEDVR